MNAGHALDLALGRKSFVKSLVAEGAHFFSPRRQPFAPALDPPFLRFSILGGQVRTNAQHRLERDRLGHHVIGVSPSFGPNLRRRLQEITYDAVITDGRALVSTLLLDLRPGPLYPAMNLVIQL